MIEFLCKNPQCQKAFDQKIRLSQVNLQDLHQLPKNTLGFCYADHLIQKGLTPLQGQEVNDNYQYLGNHLRETHDIWHIVTGCDTDILGEIQLEAFYVGQLYASRFWLALIVKNLLKLVLDDIEKSTQYMDAITQGWMMAKQAKPLFGIQWDIYWETPLDEVRRSLNIILPEG
jgi:ubiquinone biosynthesis protein Coq4